jgi:hypothetical protein
VPATQANALPLEVGSTNLKTGTEMGDSNQLIYLKKYAHKVDGAVLEVGSKNYGSTSSFRHVYRDNEYVGVDMSEGEGVDKVLDLTSGTGDLAKSHFALVVCCSVLEHVKKPWVMAENLVSLMKDGGQLFMSVPWVWRYHAYPDDYFRFSWRGIEELFPQLVWRDKQFSTNIKNEFFDIGSQAPWPDDKLANFKWTLRGRRKHLPYLLVNMIGEKQGRK